MIDLTTRAVRHAGAEVVRCRWNKMPRTRDAPLTPPRARSSVPHRHECLRASAVRTTPLPRV